MLFNKWYIEVIIIISIVSPVLLMTDIMTGLLPGTIDSSFHHIRMLAVANDFHNGVLWPTWSPIINNGYGYPTLIFYPPAVSILGGLLIFLGMPSSVAFVTVQSLFIVLGSYGAYKFALIYGNRLSSLFAASIFIYSPLYLSQIFSLGNLSQLMALSLFPWLLWAIYYCIVESTNKWIVITAMTTGLLITAHHISFIYFLPIAALFALITIVLSNKIPFWQSFFKIAVAFTLGILLASIYLIPAIFEINNVQPLEQNFTESVSLANNLAHPDQLFSTIRPVDRLALIPNIQTIVGLPHFAIFIICFVISISPIKRITRYQRISIIFIGIVSFLSIYLTTYHSFWIWEAIPQLQIIQRPRQLYLIIIAYIITSAILGKLISDYIHPIGLIIIGTLIIFRFAPYTYSPFEGRLIENLDSPMLAIELEKETGNFGSVAHDEYKPVDFENLPSFTTCTNCYEEWTWQVFPEEDEYPADIEIISSDKYRGSAYNIDASQSFSLKLQQLYYPGWQASLDDKPVSIIPSSDGLIEIEIPNGTHELAVWYRGTDAQRVGTLLTIFAMISLISLGLYNSLRRKQLSDNHAIEHNDSDPIMTHDQHLSWTMAFAVLILLWGIINVSIIEPKTSWFRYEGTLEEPLYMENTVSKIFVTNENQPLFKLIGYTVSTDENVSYGEWIYLTLYWQPLEPIDLAWNINVELTNPYTGQTWKNNDTSFPGSIPTSIWKTDHYVIDQRIIRIDDDVPPYVGNLSVSIYNHDDRLIIEGTSDTRLDLQNIVMEGKNATKLPSKIISIDANFGDLIDVKGYCFDTIDEDYYLNLYLNATTNLDTNYVVLIHHWDNNEFIGADDQPPITAYPTTAWREDQLLKSQLTISIPERATSIKVGFYDLSTIERVPLLNKQSDSMSPETFTIELDNHMIADNMLCKS